MSHDFNDLTRLPGTPQEQAWLLARLDTLSEWEAAVLAALTIRQPPRSAADAVGCLLSLESGTVIAADSYEALGEYRFRALAKDLADELLEHADLYRLGTAFEDEHPGMFVGNYYVVYPPDGAAPAYTGQCLLPPDGGWSVKLKLASPAAPEGVWLRLPDYPDLRAADSGIREVSTVMNSLRVQSLDDCALLEARCILPEAGNLMEQYDSITELVRDGGNLGYILDERGQGAAHWMEKFAAALEYEGCRDLRLALDISQNMHCYEWVACDSLKDFASNHLRSRGASEELIQSGCVDLKAYAENLLEASGFLLTGDEKGYVLRNARQFVREYSAKNQAVPAELPSREPENGEKAPRDILSATPALAAVSGPASPEEAEAARQSLSQSLAGRGQAGLRQLQAALEYADCGSLREAVEIAANLDSYDFVETGGFQEAAKRELLEKGLDEKILRCFDFESYAAIVHDFGDIYSSSVGLYVHRKDAMSPPERGGMTMQ